MTVLYDIIQECEKQKSCNNCVFCNDDRPCIFNAMPRDWDIDELQIAIELMYKPKGIILISPKKPKKETNK